MLSDLEQVRELVSGVYPAFPPVSFRLSPKQAAEAKAAADELESAYSGLPHRCGIVLFDCQQAVTGAAAVLRFRGYDWSHVVPRSRMRFPFRVAASSVLPEVVVMAEGGFRFEVHRSTTAAEERRAVLAAAQRTKVHTVEVWRRLEKVTEAVESMTFGKPHALEPIYNGWCVRGHFVAEADAMLFRLTVDEAAKITTKAYRK